MGEMKRRHDDITKARPRRSRVLRRTVDLMVAIPALLLALPILLVAATAIKVDAGGPVLQRHARIGRDGASFEMLTLRTAVVGSAAGAPPEQTSGVFGDGVNESVVVRIIRTMSIDELPQLWNVVRGQMSLVGPAPLRPSRIAGSALHPGELLGVTPGMIVSPDESDR